ncbi:MAG: MBL fold metallo-hydrolase [Bacillota bacterium]
MFLNFYGAAETVTGSCFVLEVAGRKVMIDCGMFQGPRSIRERNYQKFPFSPRNIDFVLLTHAHIDHSGLVPKLFKHGFRGEVFATAATVDLCEVMLPDSGYIQEMEVERLNRKYRRAGQALVDPIYTEEDAWNCVQRFSRVALNEWLELTPHIRARFLNAGHILGSAIIELHVDYLGANNTLVFSGDLGGDDKPYVHDPDTVDQADFVIMECTYGNRLHRDKEDRIKKLEQVIRETYRKGGNLIIPAFAVERTQDLLYDINILSNSNRIPVMDVYIDSPMAIAATEVFRKHTDSFDTETQNLINDGFDPLSMPGLRLSRTAEDSKALNNINGAIILAASGMCDAGRIKHHLRHNLWRPESTILFVGYQAPATRGDYLLRGSKMIRLFDEDIAVKADIRRIDGYSSHADQQALLAWLKAIENKPKKVFLVHGAPDGLETMARLIPDQLNIDAYVPGWQESVELAAATTITADRVREIQAGVAAKLQKLLAADLDERVLESVMTRLAELEVMLDEEMNVKG